MEFLKENPMYEHSLNSGLVQSECCLDGKSQNKQQKKKKRKNSMALSPKSKKEFNTVTLLHFNYLKL